MAAVKKKNSSKKVSASKSADKELAPATASAIDFSADAGSGMEGVDKDSFATPFLRVLQKISPQCDEGESAYIEGARGGMLLNTVTGQLHDGKQGVIFLPCAYQRRFLQWAPRGSDRGYMGEFMPEDIAAMRREGAVVEDEGRLYVPLEDGTVSDKKCDRMIDTRSHFGLLIDEETEEPISEVLLAISSTQIKKSKQLMTMLNSVRVEGPNGLVAPPTWLNRIRITTVQESNDQGSWHGVQFAPDGHITNAATYDRARGFHSAIESGEAKADHAKAAEDAEAAAGGDGGEF